MTASAALDLRPEHHQLVTAILRVHVPGHEVWAFGSRAQGTAKPYSDLDLAVLSPTPLPIATLAALEEAFTESALPFKVDLIDWAGTPPHFQQIIARQHVVLVPGVTTGKPADTDS